MNKKKKKVGRPATGQVPIRHIRIVNWSNIPEKNKSRWINEAISEKLARDAQ